MFALIKKDCYYGVTTDLNFVLLDNKTKKSRNRCISTASRLFLWSEWRDLNSRPLDPQSNQYGIYLDFWGKNHYILWLHLIQTA